MELVEYIFICAVGMVEICVCAVKSVRMVWLLQDSAHEFCSVFF